MKCVSILAYCSITGDNINRQVASRVAKLLELDPGVVVTKIRLSHSKIALTMTLQQSAETPIQEKLKIGRGFAEGLLADIWENLKLGEVVVEVRTVPIMAGFNK